MKSESGVLRQLLEKVIGSERTERLFHVLVIHPDLAADQGPQVSRAILAQALTMLLFEDLLQRVPASKIYVEQCLHDGKTVMHDHGAVRTAALLGMAMAHLPSVQRPTTHILR